MNKDIKNEYKEFNHDDNLYYFYLIKKEIIISVYLYNIDTHIH